jgi:hypothetical protein
MAGLDEVETVKSRAKTVGKLSSVYLIAYGIGFAIDAFLFPEGNTSDSIGHAFGSAASGLEAVLEVPIKRLLWRRAFRRRAWELVGHVGEAVQHAGMDSPSFSELEHLSRQLTYELNSWQRGITTDQEIEVLVERTRQQYLEIDRRLRQPRATQIPSATRPKKPRLRDPPGRSLPRKK